METTCIIKIAIIGAESTGKSWLCENLATHYNTEWVPEYAREYFNDSDIYNYSTADLVEIASKQIELEERLTRKANRFLFCDTTLITLKIWAELEFAAIPPIIESNLSRIRYDYYFITNNDVPWVKDDQRQNKFSRELLFEMNEREVKKLAAPYTVISGRDSERLERAISVIDEKFM